MQPIDTAPRVTSGPRDRGCLIGGLWNPDAKCWMRFALIEWINVIGWYEAYSGKSAHWVTHWMALPHHPTLELGEDE